MEALRAMGGVEGVARALESHTREGLNPQGQGLASVEEHKRVYGANKYREVPPKSFFSLAWENLQDPIICLLIAAALVRAQLLHGGASSGGGANSAHGAASTTLGCEQELLALSMLH